MEVAVAACLGLHYYDNKKLWVVKIFLSLKKIKVFLFVF
jgi:hypothetical protein